jgi:hypothetical protein
LQLEGSGIRGIRGSSGKTIELLLLHWNPGILEPLRLETSKSKPETPLLGKRLDKKNILKVN